MPIYEYACSTCGHKWDVFQKMSDPAPSACPSCSAAEVRKLISATNFVLKGGGWYKDHYGLKSDSDAKSESAPAKSESAPAKAEAAPAAPAASAPAKADSGASSSPASGGSSTATP